jgi:hypothetical protein
LPFLSFRRGAGDEDAGAQPFNATEDLTTDNITSMTVFAHHTGTEDWASASYSSTPNFMYNQKVGKTGDVWIYTPVKYWPMPEEGQEQKISFFAMSHPPGTGGFTVVPGYTGYPSFGYTGDYKDQHDICVASAFDRTESDGKVPFHFEHVMAKVSFKIQIVSSSSSLPGDAAYATLPSIPVNDLQTSGTLTLTADSFTWTAAGTTPIFISFGGEDFPLKIGDNDLGTVLIMPQAIQISSSSLPTMRLYNSDKKFIAQGSTSSISLSALTVKAGEEIILQWTIDIDEISWNWF